MKKFYAFLVVGIIATACATNPLTGRSSLALVSNAEIIPQAFAQYTEVLGQSKVLKGTADANMIKKVGAKLKLAAEKFYQDQGLSNQLAGYEWEFNLIENEQVNAWCMPGGKVAFYSGIMPICQDETGVAVVMGHEIAHALAGHGAEKMSQTMVAQYGGQIAGSSISNEKWANVFNQYYPMGAQLTLLRYGRKQELDADKAGLFLMAMAGYNPRQAPTFWQRMSAASGGSSQPEFVSTHPNPETRITDIQNNMEVALQYYRAAGGK